MSEGKTDAQPRHLGKLPPRYRFFPNPYPDCRFTTCPICEKRTKWRKFVLLIHIDPQVLLALNKHCRFCPDCELLIAHQDELETELAGHLSSQDPSVIGNDYLVLGTMERATWRQGRQQPQSLGQALEQVADFEEELTFHVRPAGWYQEDGE